MKLTELDAHDYLKSLALVEEPSEVHGTDGGALWRVSDDHFVLLVCKDPEHEAHKGPDMLRRVIPAAWGIFYSAANPDLDFEVYHYGPVDE